MNLSKDTTAVLATVQQISAESFALLLSILKAVTENNREALIEVRANAAESLHAPLNTLIESVTQTENQVDKNSQMEAQSPNEINGGKANG